MMKFIQDHGIPVAKSVSARLFAYGFSEQDRCNQRRIVGQTTRKLKHNQSKNSHEEN
jgi:hypothetical protein